MPYLTDLYGAGCVAEAGEVLKNLATRRVDPQDAALMDDAWSVFLYETGDFEAAAFRCRLALESRPQDARLWTNLGACLAAAGRREEALEALGAARAIDPNHLRADYLACREAPHATINLHAQDPYAVRYARLFALMVPFFPGVSEVLDISLHERPGDLWTCIALPEEPGLRFPARPGLPVVAATWSDQGFFFRSGIVEDVSPGEQHLHVRGTGPEGVWIQRRNHVRISARDFREGALAASAPLLGDVAVQDISAGGIAFLAVTGVSPGTAVMITLEFYGESLKTAAIVRRCVPKGDRFLVSAEFAPDEDLMEKLIAKVNDLARPAPEAGEAR